MHRKFLQTLGVTAVVIGSYTSCTALTGVPVKTWEIPRPCMDVLGGQETCVKKDQSSSTLYWCTSKVSEKKILITLAACDEKDSDCAKFINELKHGACPSNVPPVKFQ